MLDGSAGRVAADQPAYDVVLALSGGDAVGDWPETTGFGDAARRLTVIEPGPPDQALDAWWHAVSQARLGRRHLVVVLGNLPVGNEIIPPLLAELARDPMLGTAQPRFADARTDGLWPLPFDGGDAELVSRDCLHLLPESVVTTEFLAACVVIRREVVIAMERPGDAQSPAGALARQLCRARRRGFRNVVVNRVVVPSTLPPDQVYPRLPAAEEDALRASFPDVELAAAENRALFAPQLDRLLSAAYPAPGTARRLLLDCRGLGPIHNGTSQCMLGILGGFAELGSSWAIHVQSSPEAAAFHRLPERFPAFTHRHGPPAGTYAAVVLPNQPWSLEHMAELHRHGLLLGFNILDTISWDILYVGPPNLEKTWRFVARHSDLLTFISAYSRDRFRRRFPIADGVRDAVVYLSLAADEQRIDQFLDLPVAGHVLLFGNAYEHKGLAPAIEVLAPAFPLQRFAVLGGGIGPVPPNVQVIPSGTADGNTVHRLIATARAIVYPSFYEGFGLPVVEGLAYGRTVLVRRSVLWAEIAAHSSFEAELVEFDDDVSLIETLGAVLAGDAAEGLRFGSALGPDQKPSRWRDAAATFLRLIEEQLAAPDVHRWQDRADSLRLAGLL